jgi:hypothetical protein
MAEAWEAFIKRHTTWGPFKYSIHISHGWKKLPVAWAFTEWGAVSKAARIIRRSRRRG